MSRFVRDFDVLFWEELIDSDGAPGLDISADPSGVRILTPRLPPTLGFYGVIDERLDTDLLARGADLRPDIHFEIVGPVVKIDPANLPQRPNLHYLGPCAYADLPTLFGALARSDDALCPQ